MGVTSATAHDGTPVVVRPGRYRQFPSGHRRFALVVEQGAADSFQVEAAAGGSPYEECRTVVAAPGHTLADLLRTELPDDCDVLVVAAADALLSAPPAAVGPGRTVATVRAGGEGPAGVRARALLAALEQSDPGDLRCRAEELASAVDGAAGLRVDDPLTGATAVLSYASPTWSEWDAGFFRPGSALPAPTGRLRLAAGAAATGSGLDGQVTVKGRPVVRARDARAGSAQQVYERLTGLFHYPLVLSVDHGTVTGLKAAAAGSAAAGAELERLFALHPGHALAGALEFGLNTAVAAQPFNTEANAAATGRATASAHLVLGSLGHTPYELALPLSTSTVGALGTGTPLAGAGTDPAGDRARRHQVAVPVTG
ncbi:hypothetical protein GCM10010218_07480 [Streptomyces mashuensis]|uniref:Uncharacterized protein n=2 Tax=Streptomyces mashuensis TaxID=33904 RepID=A0A919AXX9_9ACTN|nr:hypothetical protein GCM10010218_07480 [Streptomyces mashuensis]